MAAIQLRPKKPLPIEEHETTIVIDCEAKASVYSSDHKMIEKFQQWLKDYPDLIGLHSDDDYGTHISVPKKWIKIKPPKQMSDEWRANAAQRLQVTRAKKISGSDKTP